MERPEVLELGPGRSAPAVSLKRRDDAAEALGLLGLDGPRPTLVVVGGAGGLDDAGVAALVPYAEAIVRAATAVGATIVDGGTDAGVMQAVGRAHAAAGSGLPLVGVVVDELAGRPGEPAAENAAPLEPHHTHFMLVPGASWGDEAPWIARIAGLLAGSSPSTTVLVNGGEIAWTDVAESVASGRPVLVVVGTQRTADALVAALAGEPTDPRAAPLVDTGLVEAVSLGQDGRPPLEQRVKEILGSRPAHGR